MNQPGTEEYPMATLIAFFEVEDGARWSTAWRKGVGSRHEMFDQIGVTARTFQDPDHPNSVGHIMEVPDMEQFKSFMASDEATRAMKADCIKIESMRILSELTP